MLSVYALPAYFTVADLHSHLDFHQELIEVANERGVT